MWLLVSFRDFTGFPRLNSYPDRNEAFAILSNRLDGFRFFAIHPKVFLDALKKGCPKYGAGIVQQ